MQQYDDTTENEGGLSQSQMDSRLKVQQLFLKWLKEATDARLLSGIEEEWQLAEDLFAGVEPDSGTDQPQAKLKPVRGKSRVIINITKPKTNIATSQIIRRVLPGDMRPWDVKATPVPEFDQAITGGSKDPVRLADGSTAEASKVAAAAKEMLRTKAQRMGDQIQDWLTDTGIYRGKSAYAELRAMVKDGGRVGTGVIKGPFPTSLEERRWTMQDGVAVIASREKLVPRVRRIHARNCYPDPSCGDDIHAGSYFIERDYLTERQVRDLARQPGYEPEDLTTVLNEGPQSWSRFDDRYKDERPGQTRVFDRTNYETFYLYAEVSPKQLIGCGYRVPALTMAPQGVGGPEAELFLAQQIEQAMQLTSIPVVATMINGRVVKVVLNPNEKGGFPYRFFRWNEVEGRPWGQGVPIQMAAAQLGLTASVRAMFENAGQSAGPQVVYAEGAVQPVDGKLNTNRGKHWTFTPSEQLDDVRKAFALFNIPSVQEQMFNIIKACQEWADQLANIPLLMQGITGASPETLGGMEMLEANAASPLLDIAKEYDECVGPLISDFYDWAMQDPNVSKDAKGDFRCVALGATVLIHRDRKALALQQVAVPMAGNPAFGLSPERVGEQVLRAVEIDPDEVKLTDSEKQQQAQQQPPQDPRIQAAAIKAESDAAREASRRESEAQERQFKAEQAERDRVFKKLLADIEVQVATLQMADDRNLNIEQLRASLAETAMTLRSKRDLFVAERRFAVTEGGGRGL